jgi:hypothetical protein
VGANDPRAAPQWWPVAALRSSRQRTSPASHGKACMAPPVANDLRQRSASNSAPHGRSAGAAARLGSRDRPNSAPVRIRTDRCGRGVNCPPRRGAAEANEPGHGGERRAEFFVLADSQLAHIGVNF